jgi:hypothetical protein
MATYRVRSVVEDKSVRRKRLKKSGGSARRILVKQCEQYAKGQKRRRLYSLVILDSLVVLDRQEDLEDDQEPEGTERSERLSSRGSAAGEIQGKRNKASRLLRRARLARRQEIITVATPPRNLIHNVRTTPETVLSHALVTYATSVDQALDEVFDSIHGLMRQGMGKKVDKLLDSVLVDRYPLTLLLGLLTVTLAWRIQLTRRDAFVERIRARIRLECQPREQELLGGLA